MNQPEFADLFRTPASSIGRQYALRHLAANDMVEVMGGPMVAAEVIGTFGEPWSPFFNVVLWNHPLGLSADGLNHDGGW